MDYGTLENIIAKCGDYIRDEGILPERIEFIWHGGEPLLAGLDFYKKVIELQLKQPDIKFINKLQTNGTLMTDSFAEFFNDFHFQVGFSLDGPEETHNRHRILRNGHIGSYEAVIKGIEKFRKYGDHPLVSVIAVVTKYTVERGAGEFYRFFRQLGTTVQLDPYDVTCNVSAVGEPRQQAETFMPSPPDYAKFLMDLFDIWFYDEPGNIQFRDLKNVVKF
jgi:uncharacterized protein